MEAGKRWRVVILVAGGVLATLIGWNLYATGRGRVVFESKVEGVRGDVSNEEVDKIFRVTGGMGSIEIEAGFHCGGGEADEAFMRMAENKIIINFRDNDGAIYNMWARYVLKGKIRNLPPGRYQVEIDPECGGIKNGKKEVWVMQGK